MDSDQAESERRGLKRLGFVRVAAMEAAAQASCLCALAKRNSGPLGSAAGRLEGVVVFFAGPVCRKLGPVPDYLLSVLDTAVDISANKFDTYAPTFAKRVVTGAHAYAVSVAEKAHKFFIEARTAGPKAALNYAAEETKQVVIDQTAKVWVALHRLPVICQLAKRVGPVIAFCAKKYNRVVKRVKAKNLVLIKYLPSIPAGEVAKAIKRHESGKDEGSPATEKIPDHEKESSSGSDLE